MRTLPRRWIPLLACLVITGAVTAAFAVRLTSVLESPNLIGTDPVTRVLYSEILRVQGWRALMDTTTWLPLHMWILGWSRHFIDDPNLAARLPTIIGGSLCAWPAFLLGWRASVALGRRATPDAGAALVAGSVAAALVATEPLSICYGTVSFAAPMAAAMTLAATAALTPIGLPILRVLDPPRPSGRRWWLAVPLLAGAMLLRYEAWCFVLLIGLCARASIRDRAIASALALAPGLSWVLPRTFDVLQNSLIHQDVGEAVPAMSEERIQAIVLLWDAVVRYGSPVLLWGGLLGCALLLRRGRAHWALPGTALGLFAFLVVLALMGHVPMADRYVTITMAALCAALGGTLGHLVALGGSGARRSIAVVLAVMVTGAQISQFRDETSRWIVRGPAGLDEVASMLAEAYGERPAPVYIDPHGLTALYHYWKARIPLRHLAGPAGHGAHVEEFPEVVRALRDGGAAPALLVLTDLSPMSLALDVPPARCGVEALPSARLVCLGGRGRYRLFRVELARSEPAQEQ